MHCIMRPYLLVTKWIAHFFATRRLQDNSTTFITSITLLPYQFNSMLYQWTIQRRFKREMFGGYWMRFIIFWIFIFVSVQCLGWMVGRPLGHPTFSLDKIGQHAECSHCVLRTYCIQKPHLLMVFDTPPSIFISMLEIKTTLPFKV